jgi:hypothetical protein
MTTFEEECLRQIADFLVTRTAEQKQAQSVARATLVHLREARRPRLNLR